MPLGSDIRLCQLFELTVHSCDIALIRKAEISIVTDDQVLVNHYSHDFSRKNQLTGNVNIFRRRLGIA